MKKKAIKICSLIGLLIGLMVSAQAQAPTQYRVNIPFDFNVENRVFEAGDYVIALTNAGQYKEVVTIREAKSTRVKVFQVIPKMTNKTPQISQLVFNLYGDQYFLSEMISPTINAEFYKEKTEETLAKAQKPTQKVLAIR